MRRLAAVAALALVTAACGGGDGDSGGAGARTVEIEMRDIAYAPAAVSVAKGEKVRFVFTNRGKLPHDAFIGDEAAQADHEAKMRNGDDGGGGMGGMGDKGGITVEPGKTGELEETFEEAGTTVIGCHQSGHYDAGMKITVTVT